MQKCDLCFVSMFLLLVGAKEAIHFWFSFLQVSLLCACTHVSSDTELEPSVSPLHTENLLKREETVSKAGFVLQLFTQ